MAEITFASYELHIKKSSFPDMKTKAKFITSLKIWIVIYPSITLFLYLFGKPLSVLPLYQRTLLLTIALVPWIVYFGLPLVNFIIRLVSPEATKNSAR
jgi:antibiotic biosynthesis monooxygenase (ABM) superfamily enzyme